MAYILLLLVFALHYAAHPRRMPVLFCTWSMASLWCFKRSLVWTMVLDTSPCPLTLLKTNCLVHYAETCWMHLEKGHLHDKHGSSLSSTAWYIQYLIICTPINQSFRMVYQMICIHIFNAYDVVVVVVVVVVVITKVLHCGCAPESSAIAHVSRYWPHLGVGKWTSTSWKLKIVVYCRFWPSTYWSTCRIKLTTWDSKKKTSSDNPHWKATPSQTSSNLAMEDWRSVFSKAFRSGSTAATLSLIILIFSSRNREANGEPIWSLTMTVG